MGRRCCFGRRPLRAGSVALHGCCPCWQSLMQAIALTGSRPNHGGCPLRPSCGRPNYRLPIRPCTRLLLLAATPTGNYPCKRPKP
ncbi:hypothetical protein B296_00027932 [Ensete ventricosum]|uniref:Uncharacterized protein n=1 Tax=Ensete ventricosum TaxID=4639 RepID=A0A426XC64_ENSVE|nr:hypothetical protein B296_00027932 [Ensete ventricosum]